MNVASDFVLVKQDGWGVLWFFKRRGWWTTSLEEAKVFATQAKAEAALGKMVSPSAKYLTVDEARAELGK